MHALSCCATQCAPQPINSREPNNMFPPEECAVANYTETFKRAWGWADVRCNDKFVYMCKTIRGWPGRSLVLILQDTC
jgi:hypothetical protein